MKEFKPGIYKHFKGDNIEAFMAGKHSETEEDMVVYEHNGNIWIRPLEMFLGNKKFEDGTEVERFEFVSEK